MLECVMTESSFIIDRLSTKLSFVYAKLSFHWCRLKLKSINCKRNNVVSPFQLLVVLKQ